MTSEETLGWTQNHLWLEYGAISKWIAEKKKETKQQKRKKQKSSSKSKAKAKATKAEMRSHVAALQEAKQRTTHQAPMASGGVRKAQSSIDKGCTIPEF